MRSPVPSERSHFSSQPGTPAPGPGPGAGAIHSPEQQEQNNTPIELAYLPGEDPSLFEQPEGCREEPHIRLAYLNAVTAQVIDSTKRKGVERTLKTTLAGYELLQPLPTRPKPVTTIESVHRRLGIEAEPYMYTQPMCSVCYHPYSYEEINAARSRSCTKPSCQGIFWDYADNNRSVRRAPRVAAYGNIIASFRRLFMRPDFVEGLKRGTATHEKHSKDGVLHDVCCGSAWDPSQFNLERSVSADGTIADVPRPQENRIALGFGLFASMNVDWFKISDRYSVGGIYLSILNLERSMRNRPWNVILACAIPGPGEPSLEDLNHVLQPVVDAFKTLYAGITMRVYEETLPGQIEPRIDWVALKIHMSNNDSPARAKVTGIPGQRSNRFFCICHAHQEDINTPKGYDINGFVMRDDWEALQLSYDIRGANTEEREDFASAHGVRWSAMNELPGWLTYLSAPLDLMHNLFLGIVLHLWHDVLLAGYYFTASERKRVDSFIDSVQWPSSVGRVPKNLTSGASKKADEWRRLATILPVVLWFAWRDNLDRIPPGAPRVPRDAKNPPKFTRCRQRLYDLVLYLCVATSLLGSATVTLDAVSRGQTFLRHFCEGLLAMRVHLKPNHHWAMHYEPIFRRFGPAYAWWVYAYERFNGLLQAINLNYHPGQMEATLMRFWVRMHRLYELSLFLPEDATPAEKELMESVCREFGKRSSTTVSGPSPSTSGLAAPSTDRQAPANLRRLEHSGVYELLLAYAQARWPDMDLRNDLDLAPGGRLFMGDQVTYMLSYVTKSGVRFGSSSAQRTRRDQYAFVKLGRQNVPCRLLYHFEIRVPGQQPAICSLIQRFVRDDNLPRFPWDIRAVELGIYTAYADQLGVMEVVNSEMIQAPLALCIVRTKQQNTKIWIAVMYEKGGIQDDGDEGEEDEEVPGSE